MDDLTLSVGAAIDAAQKALEAAKNAPGTDPRSLAVARTQFETAFLWLGNAIGGEPVFHA